MPVLLPRSEPSPLDLPRVEHREHPPASLRVAPLQIPLRPARDDHLPREPTPRHGLEAVRQDSPRSHYQRSQNLLSDEGRGKRQRLRQG